LKNLSFVTWMLGWPIFDAGTEYLHTGMFQHREHEIFEGLTTFVMILIWVYVGQKLYVTPKKRKAS
jgi:hypothetical protein